MTAMMLAGEDALKMLIRKPSEALIDFVKDNLDDEDAILLKIPRYDVPKFEFETQVLKEMKVVLKDNIEKIADLCKDELFEFESFVPFYNGLTNFEYQHKDKLLDFIKYFFLDHI